MEFVTTTRGGRALIYEGYKYVLNRRGRDDRIFWRCGKSRSCSGALTTIENEIVSSRAHEHNHPPNEAEMIACKAVEGMKQAVKEKIDPVPAIYQEHLQGISAREDLEEVAAQLPTLSSMKSSLYRLRRKRLPPFPTSRDEVHFEGEWTETNAGELFLLAEDGEGDDKIIIFSTAANLKHLSESDKIYVDGTFQTCPRLFYQIFTLHAFKHGKQFPLAYCLLPGKSRAIYQRAFEIVKRKAEELELDLEPDEVLTDFELAAIQGIQLAFPTTQVKGCFFHFAQALNRKISTLGLQVAYREDRAFNSFIRQTVALAFVPLQYVGLAFHALKMTAPNLPRVDEFIKYFEDTWLVGNFPPRLWNVFNMDTSSPRTNNHVEGWHNKLKRIARKAHPNVYELVEIFKKEQADTEVTLAQLATGAQPPRRAKKTLIKDRRLEELKSRFATLSLAEYVRSISAHTSI